MTKKIMIDTIEYNLEEAAVDIKKILIMCKNRSLTEEDFLVLIEHVISHINFSVNARYINRKQVAKLKQEVFEKYYCSYPKEFRNRI